MEKLDELIQAIAKSGDEKVINIFLEWQEEGIKAKERLIEKLDKLLKKSEGKPETTSENSLPKHAVNNLAEFCKNISQQEDCPAEFIDIVNKEFWNLI